MVSIIIGLILCTIITILLCKWLLPIMNKLDDKFMKDK
jgi:hypothetical protein